MDKARYSILDMLNRQGVFDAGIGGWLPLLQLDGAQRDQGSGDLRVAGAMAASVIARGALRRASASVKFPQPQLHELGSPQRITGTYVMREDRAGRAFPRPGGGTRPS